MNPAFTPVTLKQMKGHLVVYAFQAFGILAALLYGWLFELPFAIVMRPLIAIILIVFAAGTFLNRLTPIQQGLIAKEAMIFSVPPIVNALMLIGVMVLYIVFPVAGLALWVGVILFEGAGFLRATRDWDGYLAKVNSNAR